MNIFELWEKEIEENSQTEEAQNKFWENYLDTEKGMYEKVLKEKKPVVSGKFSNLATSFGVSETMMMGFLDGINESIKEPLELKEIQAESEIKIEIDFEKLYYNMLVVPAEWLYTLPEWDGILTAEKRKEITKSYNRSKIVVKENKVGRNDPCPCGSGKKYKKCCGR
jgi:uncharacterized protein YecA (UPF0149 family)